jgi:hypothetical protein
MAISVLSLFIAALVVSVGWWWWRSCRTMPRVEEGAYLGSLVKDIVDKRTPSMAEVAAAAATAPPNTFAGGATTSSATGTASGTASGPTSVSPFTDMSAPVYEGFAGPAVGAGEPMCLRTSSEAAALYELFASKRVSTEEGPDDLRELSLILGKISCFKRDLMSTAGMVEATRYQPFSTSHDLEPVAETTARCFAKTIPQRDLALTLDKWGSRGTFLVLRLCSALGLTEAEKDEAVRLLGAAMADVTEIAMGRCCNGGAAQIAGQSQPRMVGGYEPKPLVDMGEYKGYY